MTLSDLKIYGLNIIALALNFSGIDLLLKIILTGVAIGYTCHKWWIMYEKNKNK